MVPSESFNFTTDELLNHIKCCGLNRLTLLGSRLKLHLKNLQHNSHYLAALKNLDSISYGGSPLPPDLEIWCQNVGLKLMVRSAQSIKRRFPEPSPRFALPTANAVRFIYGPENDLIYSPLL